MLEKYVDECKLDRTQIALDIKNGKLKSENLSSLLTEINRAIETGKLDNPFIGSDYSNKRKKSEWNERYVDYLISEISSGTVFNEDGLKYLCEVSYFVNGATKRKLIKAGIILLCLVVVYFIGFFTGINHQENNTPLKEQLEKQEKEIEELKSENLGLKTKLDSISSILKDENSSSNKQEVKSVSKEIPQDELTKIINKALSGENVIEEFKNSPYSTEDLEKRAIDMELTKSQAKKLIGNPAAEKRFHLDKFKE